MAIDAAETGQAYWVTAALARDSVVGSLDVSFTADVFPQSSTISEPLLESAQSSTLDSENVDKHALAAALRLNP